MDEDEQFKAELEKMPREDLMNLIGMAIIMLSIEDNYAMLSKMDILRMMCS